MKAESKNKFQNSIAVLLLCSAVLSFAVVIPCTQVSAQETPADEDIAKDASTEINVKNADIAAVVRIFSKKTKRNYILDESVKGKVTIYLPGKVSSEEAIRILDSVLALKGFTSVPIGENLWKIVASKEAKTSTIPTVTEDDPGRKASAASVTRLVNLKYVSSEDMQQLVQQLISPDGLVNAYTGTNSLMIIDSEDNIQRIVQILNSLDVASSDRDMTIIPVKHADAVDVATKLNELLGVDAKGGANGGGALDLISARQQTSAPPPGRPGVPGQPGVAGGGSAGAKTISARGREPKIIPDERTNSIVVVADDDTTTRIKALVSQLDSELDLSGNRFYVYRCQHASADELANVLGGLVGNGGSSGSSGTGGFSRTGGTGSNRFGGDSGVGSGFGGSQFGNRGSFGSSRTTSGAGSFGSGSDSGFGGGSAFGGGGTNGNRRAGGSRLAQRGSGATAVQLGDNLSVTADPATNSLIISASKTDYEKLKELLKQLDIKRRQVLVEAMLLEVGVDESENFSMEFTTSTGGADGGVVARNDLGNLTSLLSDPTKLSNFSIAAASSGTLHLPNNITIPTQSVLLSAAQQNQNANVLSSPNILTTDNEPARIVVGQNVPFLASKATSDTNLNNTFNQIDREDVGITLSITPQISSGDFVTLNIFTEVSNVIAATLKSELGPTTTKRTGETTVIAKDGQMIVIGGLMSDDVSDTDAGVPFLKDVPVLGNLFRSSASARRRTNLLIFITPRIVKDQFDARDATLVKREEMKGVITGYDSFPDRNEILDNQQIDAVSESSELYNGPKPGTIQPPATTVDNNVTTTRSLNTNGDDVIELKSSPALPGQKVETKPQEQPAEKSELMEPSSFPSRDRSKFDQSGIDQKPAPSTAVQPVKENNAPTSPRVVEARAGMKLEMAPPAELGDTRVIVMKIDSGKSFADVPFQVGSKSRAFAVVVPAGSNAFARGFFQVGEKYHYKLEGSDVAFEPVAIFATTEEARGYYPDLNDKWYTLSPYEIMNIGNAPWIKG